MYEATVADGDDMTADDVDDLSSHARHKVTHAVV